MKYLWAPWRMQYIKSIDKKKCFLCQTLKSKKDKKNLILYRGKNFFCIMNRFPYNSGHLLIAPNGHKADLSQLTEEELLEAMCLVVKMKRALDKVLKPHGYNIGINIGRPAGAGVVGHIHIHIVPRWEGDTNFMPVFSACKTISQSLEELYSKLKKAL